MSGGPDDPVAAACQALAEYLHRLEHLVWQADTDGGSPAGLVSRHAAAPLPGNPAALMALMDAWEGVPRLEARVMYALFGHPGRRRGGSAGNMAKALRHLPDLATDLSDDDVGRVIAALDRWINGARAVRAIDETHRWRPLPRRAGEALPPRCPVCLCFQLRVDIDARPMLVQCRVPGCEDKTGERPVAFLTTDPGGRPQLAWNDGTVETAPDLTGD